MQAGIGQVQKRKMCTPYFIKGNILQFDDEMN